MKLPNETEKVLSFILKYRSDTTLFADVETLIKNFPNYADHLLLLQEYAYISVKYADDLPYLITVKAKAVNYHYEQAEEIKTSAKINFLFPLLVNFICLLVGFILGRLI